MERAGRHRSHLVQSNGQVQLAVPVVAPGDDGTVLEERQTEVSAGRDGLHPTEPTRDVALAVAIVPPSNDGAVLSKCERMVPTGGNANQPFWFGWDVGGAGSVAPELEHPVGAQCIAGPVACRDGRRAGQAGGHLRLANRVVSPGHNRPIDAEGETEAIAGGDSDDAEQPGRDVSLAEGIVTPRAYAAILVQRQGMISAGCYRRDFAKPDRVASRPCGRVAPDEDPFGRGRPRAVSLLCGRPHWRSEAQQDSHVPDQDARRQGALPPVHARHAHSRAGQRLAIGQLQAGNTRQDRCAGCDQLPQPPLWLVGQEG